jgi:hypothetical protein
MKTAMQDFIEQLENNKHLESDWEDFKNKLLEKEKEQTIDFAYGCTQHISREDIQEYFEKLYKK